MCRSLLGLWRGEQPLLQSARAGAQVQAACGRRGSMASLGQGRVWRAGCEVGATAACLTHVSQRVSRQTASSMPLRS